MAQLQLENLQLENSSISTTSPDWSRESLDCWWHPGAQLLRAIRNYQRWRDRQGMVGFCLRKLNFIHVLQHRFWSVVTGADIPLNSQIGGGLLLVHPNGIVIHPQARIGVNCLIFQQVTIVKGVTIGGNVDIGAGAKIIRPVAIGDRAQIGANAVVTHDVPPGATVVGIPARIINTQSL